MAKSGFAREHLRSFVERIERLEEEKSAAAADIREVYSEAKGQGFDTKVLRMVIRIRKLDKADWQEQQAMLDLYLSALENRAVLTVEIEERVEAKVTELEGAAAH